MCAKSLQLCLTLCDTMDCSSPGSSVHGILQARILEPVAISRGSSQQRNRTRASCGSCTAGGFFTTEPGLNPDLTLNTLFLPALPLFLAFLLQLFLPYLGERPQQGTKPPRPSPQLPEASAPSFSPTPPPRTQKARRGVICVLAFLPYQLMDSL